MNMCIRSPEPLSPASKLSVRFAEISVYALKQIASTPHCIDTAAKFLINEIPADLACVFTRVARATGEIAVSIAVSKTIPRTVTTISESITCN